MRMEELSESRYVKNPDTVERYLLNLVQDYFNNSNIASTKSKEYIIQKAVERMREEITFDNIGVLSITLPNGETRTGSVSISLEDLNGEPLIYPKLSAFNVNFGTEAKTACEGNDPRLSNARKPLEHMHEIEDIIGLKGALSSLTGKIDRVDGLVHNHLNKDVLDILVYTGSKNSIDLIALETLEHKVTTELDNITTDLLTYSQETNTKISEINNKHIEIETKIDDLKQQITDSSNNDLALAKQYTDETINNLKTEINNTLTTKEDINNIISSVKQSYTFIGSMTVNVSDILGTRPFSGKLSTIINIDEAILTKLTELNQKLEDCQISSIIQYEQINGTTTYTLYGTLPTIMISGGAVCGHVQSELIIAENSMLVSIFGSSVSDEVKNGKIIYKIYAKQNIPLL